jgi:hypothetical protein
MVEFCHFKINTVYEFKTVNTSYAELEELEASSTCNRNQTDSMKDLLKLRSQNELQVQEFISVHNSKFDCN